MMLAACGRTEVWSPEGTSAEQMDYEVDVERDVELDDASIVHVELVTPSPDPARVSLMALDAGIPLDAVIAAVCPDGTPTVELDNTGEIPALLIFVGTELRSVIWL
jgi:hypothetical protein